MQYYYLVAGLTEYPFDTSIATAAASASGGGKFNVQAIRNRIKAQLSARDQRAVELLYLYYDIVNILNHIKGSNLPFSPLGNLSEEAVQRVVDGHVGNEEQDETGVEAELTRFPRELWVLVDRFKKRYEDEQAREDVDEPDQEEILEGGLEIRMYKIFYEECERVGMTGVRSGVSVYLRRWSEADRMIRNITAAYKARAMKWPAEEVREMIIGDKELRRQLTGNQSSDFGLKGELAFMDELMGVLETNDFIERERKMDELRWNIAEELREELMDYFGIGTILCYLIHLNILYRWVALDPEHGKRAFRAMVENLTRPEKIRSEIES